MGRIVALTALAAAALLHGATDAGAQQIDQWELAETPSISYAPIVVQDGGLSGVQRGLLGVVGGAALGAGIGWWLGGVWPVGENNPEMCFGGSFLTPPRCAGGGKRSEEQIQQKRRENQEFAAISLGLMGGALGFWFAGGIERSERSLSIAPSITPGFAGTPAIGLTGRWRVGRAAR